MLGKSCYCMMHTLMNSVFPGNLCLALLHTIICLTQIAASSWEMFCLKADKKVLKISQVGWSENCFRKKVFPKRISNAGVNLRASEWADDVNVYEQGKVLSAQFLLDSEVVWCLEGCWCCLEGCWCWSSQITQQNMNQCIVIWVACKNVLRDVYLLWITCRSGNPATQPQKYIPTVLYRAVNSKSSPTTFRCVYHNRMSLLWSSTLNVDKFNWI